QLGRRAVHGADIVEMKIVAAVGSRDAPRREVAVEGRRDADLLRRNAEDVGGNLARRRLVRLPAVGRAEIKRDRAVFLELDRRAVDAAGAGALLHLGKDRDVARGVTPAGLDTDDDAHAEQAAAFARALLLLAQLVVADLLERRFEQAGIIAAVVHVAARRRVRHLLGLNQIDTPHVDRAQAQFLGDAVHRALPDVAHAGLADAAVGNYGTFIGEDRPAFERNVLDFVSVGEVVELVGEVDRERAGRSADVVDLAELESEHRAVFLHRRFDLEFLRARMAPGHHVLAAVLDPFDGPAALDREQAYDHDVLADQMDLLPEAAADVGNDDADVFELERLAQRVVDHLRHLRVDPDGELAARGVVVRDDREGLERRRAVAVDLQMLLDDLIGRLERAVDVAVGQAAFPRDIRFQLFVEQRRARLHRVAGLDDGRQRVVIDRDQFQRILGGAAVARGDGGDRLAHVADFLDGRRVFRDRFSQTRSVAPGLERLRMLDNVRRDHRCHHA